MLLNKDNKMKRISKESKTFKVFTALCSGEALTEAKARKMLNVGNLRAEVTRIRQHGYAVYRKNRVAGNGVKVTEYVIGMPSRRIVAAGYKAIQLGLA
jgi:hypothetical protein